LAVFRQRRFVPNRAIFFERDFLHGDLVAKGRSDALFGAQMGQALISVHKDHIPVERLARDFFGVDNQRNCHGPRNNRGV